jgi:hypothetical protein
MDLTQKIVTELAIKERNAGQLLVALGGTYPEIYTAIKQLSDEGKVVHGWKGSTLTYYLKTTEF